MMLSLIIKIQRVDLIIAAVSCLGGESGNPWPGMNTHDQPMKGWHRETLGMAQQINTHESP